MKRLIFNIITTFALVLLPITVFADSIKDKFGFTVQGGFTAPTDSKSVNGAGLNYEPTLKSDVGYAIGGGIIFGLTDNLCSEISAIYNRFDFNSGNGTTAVGEFTDFSLGVQYRFMPGSRFVPYVGAGLDFFYNDFDPVPDERLHNDNSFGGHLQAGMDYFLTRTLALNVELRGAIATEADISRNGVLIVKYDPSNLSGLIGIRFFY